MSLCKEPDCKAADLGDDDYCFECRQHFCREHQNNHNSERKHPDGTPVPCEGGKGKVW